MASVGGWLAYKEYQATLENAKVERTLEYVRRFYAGELRDARILLSEKEDKLLDRQKAILQSPQPIDQITLAYFDFVVEELIEHGEQSEEARAFYALLFYLEEGVMCSSREICDEDTVEDALKAYGRSFVHTYTPYLCYLRARWNDPEIGRRAECFYNQPRLEKACAQEPATTDILKNPAKYADILSTDPCGQYYQLLATQTSSPPTVP